MAVVIGHMATPLSKFIYAWHIPLFFFLSGLLIDTNKSLKESIIKDFKKLILPFVLFGLVGLVAEYIKRWLWPGFGFANGDIKLGDEIWGLLWWMDFPHLHHYGFVLWFLPALFWSKNIYLGLTKLLKNRYLVLVVSLGIAVASMYGGWKWPLGIDKGFVGLLWIGLGWALTGRFWTIGLVALLLLKLPDINVATKLLDIYGFIYSLIFINSLVGLFKWLGDKLDFLSKFGDNSMIIFVVHPYLNNLIYFLIIYWLKYNWWVEVGVVLLVVWCLTLTYEKYKKI